MAEPSDWPLVSPGVWLSVRRSPCAPARPAVFLDRDGVIIEEVGFAAAPDQVRLERGAARLIRAANAKGTPVVAVSNQSGIARGFFGWPAFAAVEARITELLAAEGARLDAVAACPFHPETTPGYGAVEAHWRKPGPGMLLALAERLNLRLDRSWLVGDRASDIEAARLAGLAGSVLVLTGYGRDNRDDALARRRRGFVVEISETPEKALGPLVAAGLAAVRK